MTATAADDVDRDILTRIISAAEDVGGASLCRRVFLVSLSVDCQSSIFAGEQERCHEQPS